MKQVLFIRPGSQPEEKIWWRESTSDEVSSLAGWEELTQLANLPTAERVCLLLPASEMIFRQFTLAKKSLGGQSSPFSWMAEETLIGEVDGLHWTVMAKKGQQVDAVGIESARLQQWLSLFQQAGLNVIQVLPDAILLPETQGGCTIAPLEESFWLRFTPFGACDIDAALLPLVMQKNGENPVCYYGTPADGLTVTQTRDGQHPLLLIQSQWKSCKANMLQGAFARHVQHSNPKGRRRNLIIGVTLVLASVLIPQAATAWLLIQQENHLQDEIVTLCQHHFPNMTQKTNLKYFFGQNLKKEKKGFFLQLDDIEKIHQQMPTLQVNSVEYDGSNGKITLLVQSQDQQVLQQFVQQSSGQFEFALQPISSQAPFTAMITGSYK